MSSASIDPRVLLAQSEWVRNLARRLLGEASAADDVAQDALVKALNEPERLLGDTPSWRAWLGRLTRNLARQSQRSQRRRARRERVAGEARTEAASDDVVERSEMHALVVRCVLELAEPARTTVLLRYFDGLSTPEIARRMQVDPALVRKRLSRALESLRERLRERDVHWMHGLMALSRAASGPAVVAGKMIMGKKLAVAAVAIVITWFAVIAWRDHSVENFANPVEPKDAEVASLDAHDEPADSRGTESRRLATIDEAQSTASVTASSLVMRGRVEDAPAAPGSGAAVGAGGVAVHASATLRSMPDAPVIALETTTDDEGRFVLSWPEADHGALRVMFTAAGDADHRLTWTWRDIRADESSVDDVVLRRVVHGDLEVIAVDAFGKARAQFELAVDGGLSTLGPASAVTDSRGHAVFANLRPAEDWGSLALRAVDDSFALVGPAPLAKRDEGGWNTLTAVFVATTALELQVLRADGTPRPGGQVELSLAGTESARGPFFGPSTLQLGNPDQQGWVRFERVWTGHQLELAVNGDDARLLSQRQLDGELIWDTDPERGESIVAREGEVLRVRASLPAAFSLGGRVVTAEGTAAAGAWVGVRDPLTQIERETLVDAAGRFEIQLPAAGAARDWLVYAAQGEVSLNSLIGRGPVEGLESLCIKEVRIDPRTRSTQIEMRLERGRALAGRVIGAERAIVRGSIRAMPVDVAPAHGADAFRGGFAELDEGGRFRLAGLAPGAYVVDFAPVSVEEFAASPVRRRFGPFEAGREDLELRFVDQPVVHIRIEVAAADLAAEAIASVRAVFIRREARTQVAPTASSARSFEHLEQRHAWPEYARLDIHGGISVAEEHGVSYECLYLSGSGAAIELPPLDEGTYRIAVFASGVDGATFATAGTDFLAYHAGDYALRAQLESTTEITGVVRGSHDALRIQCVDGAGRALAVRGADPHFHTMIPLAGDGRFRLRMVPLSARSIRIGTATELLEGRRQMERALPVDHSVPLEIELDR